MDNFISILRDANSPEELENLKVQLFRENVRIKTDRADLEDLKLEISREKDELDELKAQLEKTRKQFDKEVAEINTTIESNRKKLENDMVFLNKKQMVLENGFKQLDIDRQRLNNEKIEFRRIKDSTSIRRNIPVLEYRQGIFFKGITNEKALKKRYKDLIKVFHPDNSSGDTDTLQNINREYETLLHDINMNK